MPRIRSHKPGLALDREPPAASSPPTPAARLLHHKASPVPAPGLQAVGERTSLRPVAANRMPSPEAAPAVKPAAARPSTIRSVSSIEASGSSPDSRHSSAFSSSINSTASTSSALPLHLARGDSLTETPLRWSANSIDRNAVRAAFDLAQQASNPPDGPDPDPLPWDSTIGKAGLGKTGRVINKLVSDNDALKRDIQIERLRADEARQTARLTEDKMERMMSDYEGRLLDANVTKTLLARKERQVEALSTALAAEKKKAATALDREQGWLEELNRVRSESAARIQEATSYAQLMEGRYNAISSHWRDQGEAAERTIGTIKAEVAAVVDQRRADDDRIQTLADLCRQQDSNIRQLRRQKDDLAARFDDYKREQEDGLREIKAGAQRREEEQERLLHESREALAKLRWALNVKTNVSYAQ